MMTDKDWKEYYEEQKLKQETKTLKEKERYFRLKNRGFFEKIGDFLF